MGGASELVSKWCSAAIVNAGDGKHEHPTQALLDVYTLRRRLGGIDGASIWIVGDVAHSRVARSNIIAFQRMGAKVTVAGPPTLIPRGIEALGCDVRFTLDELDSADVVYALRMQRERMSEMVPSLREYAAWYQINGRRLSPHQILMHPGPVNRGVELSGEVVDSPQAVITAQVEAGVVVRMAVLYEAARRGQGARARTRTGAERRRQPGRAPACDGRRSLVHGPLLPVDLLLRDVHVLDPRAGLDAPRRARARRAIAELARARHARGRRRRKSSRGRGRSAGAGLPSIPMSICAPRDRSQGGPRVWHPLRCRGRIRCGYRDAEHRPRARLRTASALAARRRGARSAHPLSGFSPR